MEKSIFIPCVCAVHFPFVPSPDLSDFHFVLLCPGPTLPERYGLPIPVRNFDWLSFTPPPSGRLLRSFNWYQSWFGHQLALTGFVT
jgi:hypothetical protein